MSVTVIGDLDADSGNASVLLDGKGQSNWIDPGNSVIFQSSSAVGRFLIELNGERFVNEVTTYSWHRRAQRNQNYVLYYSDMETAPPSGVGISDSELENNGWRRIGAVATDYSNAGQVGVDFSITPAIPARYLLLCDTQVGNQTFWGEIDVKTIYETPTILTEQFVSNNSTNGAAWNKFKTIMNLSADDYIDASQNNGVTLTRVGTLDGSSGSVEKMNDGAGQLNWNDMSNSLRWKDFKTLGRVMIDLNGLQVLERFNSYAWAQNGKEKNQNYSLYSSSAAAVPSFGASISDAGLEAQGWSLLGTVDTDYDKNTSGQTGVNFYFRSGVRARHLLVVDHRTGRQQTPFSEFDVFVRNAPPPAPGVSQVPEVGELSHTVNTAQYVNINFASAFNDPIVVLGPITGNGGDPCLTQVHNITSSGFQYQVTEWNYDDGNHSANETLFYMASERGISTIKGLKAEAGSVENVKDNWVTYNFTQSFDSTPVVFAHIATVNGSADPVIPRLRNITQTSFQVRLQEEEAADGSHTREQIHFIAIEEGTASDVSFKVGKTTRSVTDNWHTVEFGRSFNNPYFLANSQSFFGSDPANIRYQSLNSTSVQVLMEEETSADSETDHVSEIVGWIVFL